MTFKEMKDVCTPSRTPIQEGIELIRSVWSHDLVALQQCAAIIRISFCHVNRLRHINSRRSALPSEDTMLVWCVVFMCDITVLYEFVEMSARLC